MAAVLICGLGYGDEGKGTITEYVAQRYKARWVIRFSGGAQAAHNVHLKDGTHHTFSQWGSATFQGVPTMLSRFMFVNPISMMSEARALIDKGVEPWGLMHIERGAPITTPFHVAANRLTEMLKGDKKDGSCGMGIGETALDLLQGNSIFIEDLGDRKKLRIKLSDMQARKAEQIEATFGNFHKTKTQAIWREWDILRSSKTVDQIVELYQDFFWRPTIEPREWWQSTLKENPMMVFEGAQGVLLDESYGWFPYNTWTNTTFSNAYELLADGDKQEVCRLGVTRAHMTRHGVGPFVSEYKKPEGYTDDNQTNEWQDGFRYGMFDVVALRYAIEVLGGIDFLAVTHLDQVQGPYFSACTAYQLPTYDLCALHPLKTPDLEEQRKLTQLLLQADPMIETFAEHVDPVETIQDLMPPGAIVAIKSYGRTLEDKISVPAFPLFSSTLLSDRHA